MPEGVKSQVIFEPIEPFGRAPGPADQAADVRPKHRGRVIEGKDRVFADLLELPLSSERASPALLADVGGPGKRAADHTGVVGMRV